jgi:hypothetical protein
VEFLKTFNGFEISMKICVFDTYFDLGEKKIIQVISVLFSNFEENAQKMAQKLKKPIQ